jgi:intracellular sulfur oxidation DsrE/DsrF family protein
MEEHHWQPRDLLPGGFLVPSGTLAVLRLQHSGYAYFRP